MSSRTLSIRRVFVFHENDSEYYSKIGRKYLPEKKKKKKTKKNANLTEERPHYLKSLLLNSIELLLHYLDRKIGAKVLIHHHIFRKF